MTLATDRALAFYGNPVLRSRCEPVQPDEPGLSGLIEDMFTAMQRHDGVGLAAPQVGDLRRVIVTAAPGYKRARGRLTLLNPELLTTGGPTTVFDEGCLSFPGLYRNVRRPSEAAIRYQDTSGETHILEDKGLLSRIIQHEIDHLDGVLFIDHLSAWGRRDVQLRMRLRRILGQLPNGAIS